MICFAKPGLTEDLYTVHKEEYSVHLTKAKPIHKRQNLSSRQTGCYIRTMTERVQLQKKKSLVIFKVLGAKMN
jgi:hypothetical protein